MIYSGNISRSGGLNGCVFAFNADTNGWLEHQYISEVGSLTLLRSVASQSNGVVNEAINIAGNSQAVPYNQDFNSDSINLTDENGHTDYYISMWFKRTSTALGRLFYLGKTGSFNRAYLDVLVLNNQILIYHVGHKLNNVNSQAYLVLNIPFNTSTYNLSNYHHLAFSFDKISKKITAWLNGVQVLASSNNINNYTNIVPYERSEIYIGSRFNRTFPLVGSIDCFYIYRENINGQKLVDQHFNNGNGIQLF